ncbi:hypothetical protein [Spongiimicrobium sp. 3-5]|uniref:hypothetical protein n=1 Tax=Spongiimicrobium sp. 3-5 TaxID=3332596 RepID=UPI003980848C
MKKVLITSVILMLGMATYAQTGVGTVTPDPDAALEVAAADKGLLLPRVALTATVNTAPLSAHVAGMAVYNTATVADVTPGYYYNDGGQWVRLASGTAETVTTFTAQADPNNYQYTSENGTQTTISPDLRQIGDSHITKDAGPGSNGTSAGAGTRNYLIGENVGSSLTSGAANVFMGAQAGQDVTSGNSNVFLGAQSGFQATIGDQNTYVGTSAGSLNTSGEENTFLGYGAGQVITGSDNNVLVGHSAGLRAGNRNVFLGAGTGTFATGSGNIIIGEKANFSSTTVNNSLNIGNLIYGNGLDGPELGLPAVISTGNIGIGIETPTEKLHVDGNILATGTITPDYVFESFYNGVSNSNPNYKMLSLKEIEAFTKVHKHLPGIPSASEVAKKGGIVLNRASELQLEKIEELYLHTIAQQKQISEKDKMIKELQGRLARLESVVETLIR